MTTDEQGFGADLEPRATPRPPSVPTDDELRPTVVLLPGMLGDDRLFESVAADLAPRVACRPARIDLDDSIGEMAASVLASAPAHFALAGHSLGGIVALEVLRRAPDRVERLALLNSSARPPSDHQLASWSALRDRVGAGDFAAAVDDQAGVNLGPAAGHLALRRCCVDMARRVGPDGFLRQLRAQGGRHDQRRELAAVAVPTLVVTGDADAVCPGEIQAELAAGVPGAVHEVIEGAGHMTPLDHPAELAGLLLAWLAR
jgi:pimeloyl-ACP methyl ester carboxylesterase